MTVNQKVTAQVRPTRADAEGEEAALGGKSGGREGEGSGVAGIIADDFYLRQTGAVRFVGSAGLIFPLCFHWLFEFCRGDSVKCNILFHLALLGFSRLQLYIFK